MKYYVLYNNKPYDVVIFSDDMYHEALAKLLWENRLKVDLLENIRDNTRLWTDKDLAIEWMKTHPSTTKP